MKKIIANSFTSAAICTFLAVFLFPSAPSAADKRSDIIYIQEVQGSMQSSLEVLAVNGKPVEMQVFPPVDVGDVVTFRVGIQNIFSSPFFSVRSETDWGPGFSYQGRLTSENVDIRHDPRSNALYAEIPQFLPATEKVFYFYTFDLKVLGCTDLDINLYSDDIYACEAIKTYHLAVRVKSPAIDFTVSPSAIEIPVGRGQAVNVEVVNTGTGSASNLMIDTDFEDFPVSIRNWSAGFRYDAATGIFRFGDTIAPDESISLNFEVQADEQSGNSLSSVPIKFDPDYTGACGNHLRGARKSVRLSLFETASDRLESGALVFDNYTRDNGVLQSKHASGILYACTPMGIFVTNAYQIGPDVRGVWKNRNASTLFTDDLHGGKLRYIPYTAEYNFDADDGFGNRWSGWQPVPDDHVRTDTNGALVIDLGFISEIDEASKGVDRIVAGNDLKVRYRVYLCENELGSNSDSWDTASMLQFAASGKSSGLSRMQWAQHLPIHVRKSAIAFSIALPDIVEDGAEYTAVIDIEKLTTADFYDLVIEVDTQNYDYLGDLRVSGLDGKTPQVSSVSGDKMVFSYIGQDSNPAVLRQGGTMRMKLRKKCDSPADIKSSATYKTLKDYYPPNADCEPGNPCGGYLLTETAEYRPLLNNAADLALRISPECSRILSPGMPASWTAYVVNQGSGTAYNVRLEQHMGRNLRYEHSTIDNLAAFPRIEYGLFSPEGTSASWVLGDLAPAESRAIAVTTYPVSSSQWDGYANAINLRSGFEDVSCREMTVEGPCFILPDECISGDIFERCGYFHTFFSATQMYKSNLYRTRRDAESVWATYVTPGFWVTVPGNCERIIEVITSSATPGGLLVNPFYPSTGRRYQFYFLYSPQIEKYYSRLDENIVTHRADLYFRYNTRNRFTFRVLDQYKRSNDSVSSRVFNIDDKYKNNLFNILGTYDATEKIRLRLDYSNFYLNYDTDENSRADRMDNAWAAYGYFYLTPKTSVFLNYEFADVNYETNGLDNQENRFFAGFRWEFTDKTSGQMKGGYGYKTYDAHGLSKSETWMTEVQVDHALTSRSRLLFNTFRRYDEALGEIVDKDDVQGNFTKNILTHFTGISYYYDITTKLHLNLDIIFFFDEYKDEKRLSTRRERRDFEFSISPAVKFNVLKWLTLDFSYIYTDRNSNYSQFDYIDHSVFLRASLFN